MYGFLYLAADTVGEGRSRCLIGKLSRPCLQRLFLQFLPACLLLSYPCCHPSPPLRGRSKKQNIVPSCKTPFGGSGCMWPKPIPIFVSVVHGFLKFGNHCSRDKISSVYIQNHHTESIIGLYVGSESVIVFKSEV